MGGGGEVQKVHAIENWEEKSHAQRVAQKKVLAYRKNIPTREMLTKKKSFISKTTLPPPPFSNGPSPRAYTLYDHHSYLLVICI